MCIYVYISLSLYIYIYMCSRLTFETGARRDGPVSSEARGHPYYCIIYVIIIDMIIIVNVIFIIHVCICMYICMYTLHARVCTSAVTLVRKVASAYLSISLYLYLSISLSLYLSISPSLYHPSIHTYIHPL